MKIRKATWVRLLVIGGAVGALEAACRGGLIKPFTMIPPSQMVLGLPHIVTDPELLVDIRNTMTSVAIALVCALAAGCVIGALLHASPRARRIAAPLLSTYYSVPVFVFYPLLIVLFGLNSIPKTVIGFLYAVVAMVINTLNGLDRVPPVFWKTARVYQLDRLDTATKVIFPCAGPYLFTGAKLAIVYSFIGVIGSEFILSSGGLGYRISFLYNNFDSGVMYALILFVLIVVITINMALFAWERALTERRGGR